MNVSATFRIGFISLLMVCLQACATNLNRKETLTTAIDHELSKQEQQLARELAERSLKISELYREPIYFTSAELYRVKQPNGQSGTERHALVSHYRYDGDLTILTYVNLSSRKIIDVESISNLPTRLSQEEFVIAKKLALSDAGVQQLLGADKEEIEVEPLVRRSVSTDDPLFGHRVVRLLFRRGRDYLREPVVVVDLTERKVIIEPAKRGD